MLSRRHIVRQRKSGGDLLDYCYLTSIRGDAEAGLSWRCPQRQRIRSSMNFLPNFLMSDQRRRSHERIECLPQPRKDINRIDAPALNE
jgi:hypothetical protein